LIRLPVPLINNFLKGHDKVAFGFSKNDSTEAIDEIQNYLDARFVSASEAAWRILKFPMSGQFPNTFRLAIHLENEQTIIYKENEPIENIVERNKTQLTEFFEFNKTSSTPLLYSEMPNHCTWNVKTKAWAARK
jgi:hypothetical protein